MESLIFHYLNLWEPFIYPVIFLAIMLEGDVTLFISSFLVYQGVLHPVPVFLTVLWAMIIGDNLWYTIGLKFRNSFPDLNQRAEKLAAALDENLKIQPFKTIFLSKFTYGIRSAIFFRAGTLKINWAEIEQSDILATLLWIAIIGGLGYFSGASFYLIRDYLRFGEVALLLGIVVFLTLESLISKRVKKKI